MSKVFTLLSGAIAQVTGQTVDLTDDNLKSPYSYQATVTGNGTVTATVAIDVSNDGIGWLNDTTSTLSLNGSGVASNGFTSVATWAFTRARLTAISGINAAVTVTIGG